ncbi:hypothetical protein FACS1894184_11850 [Clostridia bacterium]|nr:hypothetical protein FACS1894184_11850 [Clostridia bacterium]
MCHIHTRMIHMIREITARTITITTTANAMTNAIMAMKTATAAPVRSADAIY